ncbi:MAG: ACP phosphodiesterase [Marinoscillum sp.]
MNFLAHLYLSFESEPIMIGNFIGDFVKGKAFENYDIDIQKGILLHREIDKYTDDHGIVMKSKERLRPKYHHYAPVIADVFYDHFLSKMWLDYHDQPLIEFTESFYQMAKSRKSEIPERAYLMLTYMARDNWLYNYQFIEGIRRTLTGMSKRTPFESKMEQSSADLKEDYEAYQKEFITFFPELINHSKSFLASL